MQHTSGRCAGYVKHRPGNYRRYALRCDKMEKDLGWKPAVPLEDAFGRRSIGTRSMQMDGGVRAGEYLSYCDKYYENRDSPLHPLSSDGPMPPR